MKTAEERYLQDAEFHALVDMIEMMIVKKRFTPSELREAVMLAALKYEYTHARHIVTQPREHFCDNACENRH
jgi:hypothetical protein